MKPKPPKGRKGGRGRRGGGAGTTDGYSGPLSGGAVASNANHSAVTTDGVSVMYAPALQPMPRFMGAGPVANGSLLRSRACSQCSGGTTS